MSVLAGLLCPIDQQPLNPDGNGLVCAAGHRFDCAKSGYVNLLPVQQKQSKDPGDSKAMVAARRAFLDSGCYQPIAEAIAANLTGFASDAPLTLLDAGCGEGYYLHQLVQHLSSTGHDVQAQGLDISKWAVQAASKRSREIGWIVGSNASIPAAEDRFDVLLCLFGFPVFDEFRRVLKPDGLLLLADSGPDHLIELRRVLYPSIKPYRDRHADGIKGFHLEASRDVRFSFMLESQRSIHDLLAMTPHLHKASYAGREAALQLQAITLTADVQLRWYRPTTENLSSN